MLASFVLLNYSISSQSQASYQSSPVEPCNQFRQQDEKSLFNPAREQRERAPFAPLHLHTVQGPHISMSVCNIICQGEKVCGIKYLRWQSRLTAVRDGKNATLQRQILNRLHRQWRLVESQQSAGAKRVKPP